MPRGDITHLQGRRFGEAGGADPSAAATKRNNEQNPSLVRLSLRRLAAAEFDITKELTNEEIVRKFGREGLKITGAQMIAVRKFQAALKKADPKMMQQITDDIDGKQVQPTASTRLSLEELLALSQDKEYLAGGGDEQESGGE